jgi:hypothetical protein
MRVKPRRIGEVRYAGQLRRSHESPATTHQYLVADLAMQERALAAVEARRMTATRFKPRDRLLAFLDRL